MKFLVPLLLSLVSACVNPAFAASRDSEYKAEFRFNRGSGFQNDQLGTKVIEDSVRDLRVTYDFAASGGAIGAVTLPRPATPGRGAAPFGQLPKNAIVVGCYIDVLTAMNGGSGATIALSTGQAANDLKTATGFASYTGIVACVPTGSAATSIKLTADAKPTATIATNTITAGKFNVHIFYILSD